MTATNLLNLNVDTLFEQHSVPEIDIVQKKIQEVVENKREELRLAVGERYRDLLKAADTIAAMQASSQALITQVNCISAHCRSLNEQQLIGFKTSETNDLLRNRNANKQLNNYFSTMVQIKLLTALPELIWSHIDREHFYAATELFIFSRHISTGLQLDAHNPLMKHLPVAKKQWEILKPFHVTIKQSLLAVLEREELSAEVVVDCLLSLLLLEKNTLNGVFKTFLQLRCTAFLSCLSDVEQAAGESQRRRVKERILASLKILNSTMELMGKCFLQNGLLLQKLAEHADPNAPPTISLMDSNDAQFSYMLPEVISNFRPKFDAQALDGEQVRAALEQWLTDNKRIAGVHLKNLFDLVTNMNTIQEIKAEANAYKKKLNFMPIAEAFQLKQTLDFYELKYVPLIHQRVRDIINDSWTQAMQQMLESLEQALPNAEASEQHIWQENTNDLPLSLQAALSEDRKIKKLLMKSKGYNTQIIELCATFDRQLGCIVDEMSLLLEEQTTRAEDKLALIEFLRDTAQTQLTNFLGQLKQLNLSKAQRAQLLFVVRTCIALIELCPHLKMCFSQRSNWRQWVGNLAGGGGGGSGSSVDSWQRICALLEEETFNFWQQIIDGVLDENHCEKQLPAVIAHDIMLEDFVHWETVIVEQKDEQENVIQSNIRIPSQPRISLQHYLFQLIRSLNALVPQTLPLKVLHAFNEKLLQQLLVYYEKLSQQQATTTSQNVALQLYFDLKFLQLVFVISRDERALSEHFQTLQNALKDVIDPFDFEIFAEHIAANVKRSVARLSCELGVLTPMQSTQTTTTATSLAQERDPNVLSLSSTGSTSLWFPLLPIITPNAGKSLGNKRIESAATFDSEKQTTPTRKAPPTTSTARKSDTSKSKSGATSFFGAMSQEWFR